MKQDMELLRKCVKLFKTFTINKRNSLYGKMGKEIEKERLINQFLQNEDNWKGTCEETNQKIERLVELLQKKQP